MRPLGGLAAFCLSLAYACPAMAWWGARADHFLGAATPSALPADSGVVKIGSRVYRDVIGTCFNSPVLTDADVLIHFTDTRVRIATGGGPVSFYHPGIKQVLLNARPLPVLRSGPNLLQVRIPKGVHDVEISSAADAVAPGLPADFSHAGAVAAVDEFNESAKALKPGDELVVENGVYIGWANAVVSASGTARKPIVIRPETPGGVVFRRRTHIRLQGKYVEFKGFRFEQAGPAHVLYLTDGEHLRVTQCQFFGCGDPQYTYAHIVRVARHCHRSRVDHCFFTGSKSMSVGLRLHDRASAGMHNRFDHNVFRDIYRYAGNGQENIQLGGQRGDVAPRCTVEYCLFDHAWGDSEIISSKSSGNVIRYNVAAHCLFSAFTLRQGNDVRFEGNVMVNNAAGVRVFGSRHVIANNLFMDLRGSGVVLQTGSSDRVLRAPATDTLIAHNTFLNCPDSSIASERANTTNPGQVRETRVVNNLLVGAYGNHIALAGSGNAHVERNLLWAGQSADVGVRGQRAIVLDPRLEGSGVKVCPAADSPVVDQGVAMQQVDLDRWRRPRPAGRAPDLGADEVGKTAPPRDMLPELPRRPLLLPSLHKKRLIHPLAAKPRSATFSPADAAMTLFSDLPEDFVLEWDHLPGSWAARASLAFSAGAAGGYTVSWGGVDDKGVPTGVIALSKGPSAEVVADGPDVLCHRMSLRRGRGYRKPSKARPQTWYSFTLIKRQHGIWLGLRPLRSAAEVPLVPVIVWREIGRAHAGRLLQVSQKGPGTWRNVRVWSYGHRRMGPPPAPTGLTGSGVAGSLVRLRWRHGMGRGDGTRYEVYRHTDPNFTPSPSNRIAAAAMGEGLDDFKVRPRSTYTYRVRAANVVGLASDFVSAQATTIAGGPLYLYIDASAAKAVRFPLVIRTDPPSGDRYLTTPSNAGSPTQGPVEEGLAVYEFRAPKEGAYVLWGLTQAPDGSSDSFYLALDAQTLDSYFGWSTGVQDTWLWRRIRRVNLSAGRHTLYVKHREGGAKLKALLLTDDLGYRPPDQ